MFLSTNDKLQWYDKTDLSTKTLPLCRLWLHMNTMCYLSLISEFRIQFPLSQKHIYKENSVTSFMGREENKLPSWISEDNLSITDDSHTDIYFFLSIFM